MNLNKTILLEKLQNIKNFKKTIKNIDEWYNTDISFENKLLYTSILNNFYYNDSEKKK